MASTSSPRCSEQAWRWHRGYVARRIWSHPLRTSPRQADTVACRPRGGLESGSPARVGPMNCTRARSDHAPVAAKLSVTHRAHRSSLLEPARVHSLCALDSSRIDLGESDGELATRASATRGLNVGVDVFDRLAQGPTPTMPTLPRRPSARADPQWADLGRMVLERKANADQIARRRRSA